MNKYVGKICPYCKSVLTEDDMIVVCSDCDMPHHKDCWIENKGCTTFGCQGTIQGIDFEIDTNISAAPKYDVRDVLPQQNIGQPNFCGRCGSALTWGNAFCCQCGAPVGTAQQQFSFQTNVYLDPELPQYIGSNKEYYINEFSSLKRQRNYTSWNWAAFLFSSFWCMYRKMYIPGAILLSVNFIFFLIGGIFFEILALVIAAAAGLFLNYFYMCDLERRAAKGKNLAEPWKSQYIKQYGDTNATIPSVVAVIYFLICNIIFFR